MTDWLNQIVAGDALACLQQLPAGAARCCVTSPPYWGLRDYGVDGQLGREETVEEYIGKMVEIFREVRRVLADDGTLWLNMGDCYASSGGHTDTECADRRGEYQIGQRPDHADRSRRPSFRRDRRRREDDPHKAISGLKPKNLVGQPWRMAFGLQADGWYLRSDIIWHKPNPLPESVRDRPTKGHEYIFLMSKSPKYFYDADAVREKAVYGDHQRYVRGLHKAANTPGQPPHTGLRPGYKMPDGWATHEGAHGSFHRDGREKGAKSGISKDGYDERKWADRSDGLSRPPMTMKDREYHPDGRNLRSVWTIPTQPFPEAHFATFPTELVSRCVRAGSSAAGQCVECGSPWRRLVDRAFVPQQDVSQSKSVRGYGDQKPMDDSSGWDRFPRGTTKSRTTGWEASCDCGVPFPAPDLVIDPFMGAGTTAVVAKALQRSFWGCDLNPDYVAMALRRIGRPALGPSETEDLSLFE